MPDTDCVEMSWIVAARPKEVYDHWMSSKGHAAMTGGGARVEGRVGGRFTAWDGYIEGVTKKLERTRRIVQTWRTADFSRRTPDSRIAVELRAHDGQTQILLRHTKLKRGDGAKYTVYLLLPQPLRIRDMMLTLERAIKGIHRDYTPLEEVEVTPTHATNDVG